MNHARTQILQVFRHEMLKILAQIKITPYICTPNKTKPSRSNMIIVAVKEGESLEKALKKFKKKFEKTGVVRALRDRQKFTKPSIRKRETKLKAIYRQQMHQSMEM
jgi:small subunit ribosomal protein S21